MTCTYTHLFFSPLLQIVPDCLPEDVELLGFKPLQEVHTRVDFSEVSDEVPGEYSITSNVLGLADTQQKRFARIVAVAKRLVEQGSKEPRQENSVKIENAVGKSTWRLTEERTRFVRVY